MEPRAQLSFVIPVYNGSPTIGAVVERIVEVYRDLDIEIVLVNDGSPDDSERVCRELHRTHPETVTFVHLARNFGEHNAVMAGLRHSTGDYVAILDDDGQNPPEEVRHMYDEISATKQDVVFGRYQVKHHSWLRNLGSRFNDRIANVMIKKPRGLYLSSCKVMNRFLVEEITRYTGAFPYIDGLILRTTSSLGQIDIKHRGRQDSQSNYTLRKLFLLWLNMFLNFSITPLRLSAVLGAGAFLVSLVLMVAIIIDKLYINTELAVGIPTLLISVVFFAGLQLLILGTIGEYVGRLFLDQSKSPQFIARYVEVRRARD